MSRVWELCFWKKCYFQIFLPVFFILPRAMVLKLLSLKKNIVEMSYRYRHLHWAIPEITKQGRKGGEQFEDTVTFWNKSLEFQVFLLCTWKFRTKQSFTLGNSAKLCYIVGKLREQKSRTLEIPHDFFLITPGNSTSFLISPYNFYKLFLDTPGNSISSTPSVFFFK